MRVRVALIGAGLVAGLAACGDGGEKSAPAAPENAAAAAGVTVKLSDSSLGKILTDQNGRTLYAFLNDEKTTGSCTGECDSTWPALVSSAKPKAENGAKPELLTQTSRNGLSAQAKYGKWPLYYYVGDVGPGDVDGQGVDDVWFVVAADGKLVRGKS